MENKNSLGPTNALFKWLCFFLLSQACHSDTAVKFSCSWISLVIMVSVLVHLQQMAYCVFSFLLRASSPEKLLGDILGSLCPDNTSLNSHVKAETSLTMGIPVVINVGELCQLPMAWLTLFWWASDYFWSVVWRVKILIYAEWETIEWWAGWRNFQFLDHHVQHSCHRNLMSFLLF